MIEAKNTKFLYWLKLCSVIGHVGAVVGVLNGCFEYVAPTTYHYRTLAFVTPTLFV